MIQDQVATRKRKKAGLLVVAVGPVLFPSWDQAEHPAGEGLVEGEAAG